MHGQSSRLTEQQHGSTSSSSRAVHDSYAAAFCFRWFGAHLRHDDGDIIRVETAVQPPAEVHATRASHLPPQSPICQANSNPNAGEGALNIKQNKIF